MFDKEVYINRRNKLKLLVNNGIAIFFGNIESPVNYAGNTYYFRQDSSFLYFFGIDKPNLVAAIDFETGKETLYGNDPETKDIIWTGKQTSVREYGMLSGIKVTKNLKKLVNDIEQIIKTSRKIHFLPPYSDTRRIEISQLLHIRLPDIKNKFSPELVQAVIQLRSVKEEREIEEIKKTFKNVTGEMFMTAMRKAKTGKYEYEIAGAMEGIALQHGHRQAFPVICSVHGEILHNQSYNNKLKNGDILLIDAGAESKEHYATDVTRTIPVSGRFSQIQNEIYSVVLSAHDKAIEKTKQGVLFKDIHIIAAKEIIDGLKQIGFIKGNTDELVNEGLHALFFPHGIGHMLGLDVHDMEDLGENNVGYDKKTKRSKLFGNSFLRFGKNVEINHVLTIEPGIYFIPHLIRKWKSEKKFNDNVNYDKIIKYIHFGGIRIENDIVVKKIGAEILSNCIPDHISEIESLHTGK